jgi:N,N-dimethylformamidase beta subunit-like, C-terminal
MAHSERLVSLLIIIILVLVIITSHILLLLSNNKPLLAERRVSVHERSRTLNVITAFWNTESNKPRGVQRNSLSSIIIKNKIGNSTMSPPTLKSNNNSNHNYRTPINIGQLATPPKSNPTISEVRNEVQIALVEPTFTAAAYNNSFYAFYQKYNHVPANANITSDLDLLSSKVNTYPTITPTTKVHSAFAMLTLLENLRLISPRSNVTVLTDADVDDASIFKNNNNDDGVNSNARKIISTNNNNAYDVIIIGHQEYVTQREYDNLKNFVTNGGTMIVLDGNVFYAEVKYDRYTNTITLVKGHSWAFNGKSAWKSVAERWDKETSQWVGSNYLCYSCQIAFANDPFEYKHHEEQYITNPNDKILMNYNASLSNYPTPSLKKPVIATYELDYKRGKVISLGIYSDDIVTNDKFDRYFNGLFLQYALKSQE